MAAPETVIEDLVVRLTGEGSEFAKMMDQSVAKAQESAHQIEAAASRIEQFQANIGDFAGTLLEVAALLGAKALLQEAVDNFAEAELIGLKLTATLESNRRQVDETRKAYEEYAAELESLTVHEDDAILKMFTMAEAFDITGDAAKKAVKDAISLAGILEGAPESYIRLTAALAKGDTETAMRFARMVPQLRGIRNETEFLAKANQLLATGWKAALAEADSFTGTMRRLSRDWGNMTEDFGKIVSEWVKPFIKQLSRLINAVKETDETFKRVVVTVLGLAAAALSVGPALAVLGPLLRLMVTPILTVQAGIGAVLGPVLALLSPVAALKVVLGAIGFIVTGLLPAVLSLLNPLKLVLILVTAIKFAVMAYFGPFFSVLKWVLSIGAALAAWVKRVGGVQNAWDILVDSARRLWKELQPIIKAFRSLFDFIVRTGVEAILALGEKMLKWMDDLMAALNLDWLAIRDGIVTAIKFSEMVLRNFGDVARVVFGAIKALVAPLAAAVAGIFGSGGGSQAGRSLDGFAQSVTAARQALADFASRHREVLTLLAGAAGTVLIAVGAAKLLGAVLGVLQIKWAVTTAATTAAAAATTTYYLTTEIAKGATRALAAVVGAAALAWRVLAFEAMVVRGVIATVVIVFDALSAACRVATATIFSLNFAKKALYVTTIALKILLVVALIPVILWVIALFALWKGAVLAYTYAGTVATAVSAAFNVVVAATVFAIELAVAAFGAMRAAFLSWKAASIAGKVAMIAWAAGMVVWKTIMLATTGVFLLLKGVVLLVVAAFTAFNANVGVSNALTFVGKVLWLAYSAAALVVKAAIWLVNGALTVMNLLLGGGTVIAAVLTLGALAAVFAVVGSAAYAAYASVRQLFSSLSANSGQFAGPLRDLGRIFGSWLPTIKQIIDGVQYDMPRSWALLKAHAKVTLLEVQQLWPPLFEFIKTSFLAMWDIISSTFEIKFYQAIGNVVNWMAQKGSVFLKLFGLDTDALQKITDELNVQAGGAMKEVAKGAELEFRRAGTAYKRAMDNIKDDDTLTKARDELKKASEDLENARPSMWKRLAGDVLDQQAAMEKAKEDADKLGKGMDDAMVKPAKKATAEVQRFDAALKGSAEAATRIAEYRDRLETSLINKGIEAREAAEKRAGGRHRAGQHKEPAAQVGGRFDATPRHGAEGNARDARQEELLRDIRNILREQNRRPQVNINPANL